MSFHPSLLTPQSKAKRMMLWFAMISMTMMFAGLTSAYVVSKARPDWLTDFRLPAAFHLSTLVILLSSFTFWMAFSMLKRDNTNGVTRYTIITLILAVVFSISQWVGFSNIVADGYYFTGAESTVTTSFLYVLVLTHFAHLIGGIVVLLVVLIRHLKGVYLNKPLGFSLAHTFWHFLGFLWLYLFVFLFFLR
ncbi:MAG: putative cytochrome c oxidase subunit 3 [Flavobacteriales bacterium]|jgi:cytochrome c oxidase subunit 3|nr:MAG: heme-copper oxidase subunit III [Flavobacteriales bacterium]CAI8261906.1 MAG: putative cytochrome c oxidase subunit 3 [Flavobacteriales bacterium]|tara:strand:+ start:527 stop:1102 length:576 start_codon:yes stop_codon:yes gene_type:complete